MKFIFITITTLFNLVCASAQPGQQLLSGFSATQYGNTVRVDFTIVAGVSYCLGAQLERSTDGISFHVIDAIDGVCGGSEFEESYLLVDSLPAPNRLNFYRLVLGGIGESQIIAVHFVELIDGVKLFPNPASDFAWLVFENPGNIGFNFTLAGVLGQTLVFFKRTSGNEISVDTSGLETGNYAWKLEMADGTTHYGVLVVHRD